MSSLPKDEFTTKTIISKSIKKIISNFKNLEDLFLRDHPLKINFLSPWG